MKRILILVYLLIVSTSALCQSSLYTKHGYRGSVSFATNVGVTAGMMHNSFGIFTSHGKSFGDGIYAGVGAGMITAFSGDVSIPVFFDLKYNIIDWKISPYVDCRLGGEFFVNNNGGTALILSPGIGVDFKRFSFRVGYLCQAGTHLSEVFDDLHWEITEVMFKVHSMAVSIAYNF